MQGESALSFSVYGYAISESKNKDTIDYFLKHDIDIKSSLHVMHYAALSNDLKLVQYFAKRGGDIHSANHKDITPLHLALKHIQEGKTPVVAKWLVEQGVNIKDGDNYGNTPFTLCNGQQLFTFYPTASR